MAKKRGLNPKRQAWVDARKRHRLTHAQVQMARELGMNPKTLGKLDNHTQEPWKLPLPLYIEHLYEKRFGRERPEQVQSVEERARQQELRRRARKLDTLPTIDANGRFEGMTGGDDSRMLLDLETGETILVFASDDHDA
ncbi:MAG: hypothetical protein AAGF11_49525 [Myxococcota bacterium]